MGLGAGGVAELDIRVFLGSLDHVVFMTEAVGEYDVAAFVSQVCSCAVAGFRLADVGLQHILNAQLFAGFLRSVDEVQVVGRVFVMQEDEANLHLVAFGHHAHSGQAQGQNQYQSKNLLHV